MMSLMKHYHDNDPLEMSSVTVGTDQYGITPAEVDNHTPLKMELN